MLLSMKLTDISPAIALTPLDGRYHKQTAPLVEYMSEPALNRERMRVEVEWMILLANGFEGNGNQTIVPGVKPLTDDEQAYLRSIPENFGAEGIAQHAAYEAKTHHDVKAVEYYIDDQLEKAADVLGHDTQLTGLKTLVHFACTSEDINNLSIARCVKNGVEQVWLPAAQAIVDHLAQKADAYRDKAMLSLTHGQPATPTTLGKELAVYVYRLNRQLNKVKAQEYLGKINGATGTFGAHLAACPDVDWVAVSREFVTNRMGLTWNPLTTQIESHDWQAELYGTISHTNRILHNLCVDVWMYISRGVFAQVPVKGATGSSTMPHKVNPIRFENAEANLEILLLAIGHFVGDAGRITLAARSDRLHHAAQHRLRAGLFAAGVEQSDGWSELHPSERCCHPGRARFQLGGARRADPDRHARLRACRTAGYG